MKDEGMVLALAKLRALGTMAEEDFVVRLMEISGDCAGKIAAWVFAADSATIRTAFGQLGA